MADSHPSGPLSIRTRSADPASLALHLSPLLARLFSARGVASPAELDLGLASLLPPDLLPNVFAAASRLAAAVTNDEKILIVGDFDADGATSVALCVSVLRAMGARFVDFIVPNRFEFGYGLSPEIVTLAATRSPDLLVTVDNGVSSVSGVAAANGRGIDVIVTDHHLPGSELPEAIAIVNPNMPGARFASKAMAGVGVAYYLLGVTRSELREHGWFEHHPEPNLADWLDLVAVGTVADVVPLDHNNRVLISQGLRRIRAGRCRPGVLALCEVARRNPRTLKADDLGFAIGPRLNAAGRLDDMSIGIQCLLSDSEAESRKLAVALDELNRTRRELERDMVSEAELIVASHTEDVGRRYGVCVYDPSWHQGVVGIVAGRLREKINRPVIAFAEAGAMAPDELKGSARSLPELNVRDVLDAVAARYPGLVVKFGGHAMAAGLSLKRVHYERFCKAFDAAVREVLPAEALAPTIITDGDIPDAELTLGTAQHIAAAGPWGQGFPEPLFHGTFEMISQRVVGERHLKLVLKCGDKLIDAIAFGQPPLGPSPSSMALDVVFRLAENDYGDLPTLQLMVEHLAPSTAAPSTGMEQSA